MNLKKSSSLCENKHKFRELSHSGMKNSKQLEA